jgi:dTDP-4-dehydrorhamnose 3,5-epimerase
MNDDARTGPPGWMATGIRDGQTVNPDWSLVETAQIEGVVVKEIRPVATATGYLTEIFRSEWQLDGLPVDQVFQRTLEPGAVTGWHAHAVTTDRLFCGVGSVRISLYDGRRSSPTFNTVWHRIVGDRRPAIVVIPPGIWHGVTCLSSQVAVLLNLVDRSYGYAEPDHWRLPPDTEHIPFKLA